MSLWNKEQIIKENNSPRICTQTSNFMYQRTSFCTCEKGSLTVEASFIIPLTIGFLGCILFFFRILQVQAQVEEALMYAGRTVAVQSSTVSSEAALFLSAEALMISALEEDGIADTYIKNGVWGISLLGSDFTGEYITLHAEYKMQLPVNFFGRNSIKLSSENCFQKWIGNNESETQEGWVYVTPSGSVYHTNLSCRVLDIIVRQASVSDIAAYRGKNGQKYYPCGSCQRNEIGVVYYTDYGTLYHFDIACGAIKRTIRKIPVSEIGGRRECTFCQRYGLE